MAPDLPSRPPPSPPSPPSPSPSHHLQTFSCTSSMHDQSNDMSSTTKDASVSAAAAAAATVDDDGASLGDGRRAVPLASAALASGLSWAEEQSLAPKQLPDMPSPPRMHKPYEQNESELPPSSMPSPPPLPSMDDEIGAQSSAPHIRTDMLQSISATWSDKENAPPAGATRTSTIPTPHYAQSASNPPSSSPAQHRESLTQVTPGGPHQLFSGRTHVPAAITLEGEPESVAESQLTPSQPRSGGLRDRVRLQAVAESTPIRKQSSNTSRAQRAPLAPLPAIEDMGSPPSMPAYATRENATRSDPVAALIESNSPPKQLVDQRAPTAPASVQGPVRGRTTKIANWIENVGSPGELTVPVPAISPEARSDPPEAEPHTSSSDIFGILAEVRATARQTRRQAFRRPSSPDAPPVEPASNQPEPMNIDDDKLAPSPDPAQSTKRFLPSDAKDPSEQSSKRTKSDPKREQFKELKQKTKLMGQAWGAGRAGKKIAAPPGLSRAAMQFLQSLPKPGSSSVHATRATRTAHKGGLEDSEDPIRSSSAAQTSSDPVDGPPTQRTKRTTVKPKKFKSDKFISLLPLRTTATHQAKVRAGSTELSEKSSTEQESKGSSDTDPEPRQRTTARATHSTASRSTGRNQARGRGRGRRTVRSTNRSSSTRASKRTVAQRPELPDQEDEEPVAAPPTNSKGRGPKKRATSAAAEQQSNQEESSDPTQSSDQVFSTQATQGTQGTQGTTSYTTTRRSGRTVRPPPMEPTTLTGTAKPQPAVRAKPQPTAAESEQDTSSGSDTSGDEGADAGYSPVPRKATRSTSSYSKQTTKPKQVRSRTKSSTSKKIASKPTKPAGEKGKRTKNATFKTSAKTKGTKDTKGKAKQVKTVQASNKTTPKLALALDPSTEQPERRTVQHADEDSLENYNLEEEVVW